MTVRSTGGDGGSVCAAAHGLTALDAFEGGEGPALFSATIVIVYATPGPADDATHKTSQLDELRLPVNEPFLDNSHCQCSSEAAAGKHSQ